MCKIISTLSAIFILALGASGCVAMNGTPKGATGAEAAQAKAQIRVTNNNWSDMTVYVVRSGMRMQLGMVTSMTTRSFKLPANLTQPGTNVQLLADPIGSDNAYLSPPVLLLPGECITWTIHNHLSLSHFSVRK